jgi:hypothetical protein
MLSDAVPPRLRDALLVTKEGLDVGELIAIEGGEVSELQVNV